jgi:hypothetical protein
VLLPRRGLYCLLRLALLDPLGGAPAPCSNNGLTLLSAASCSRLVLFFVPAALIGVVTPLLTTLALRLDPRAGHVVGRMHALAAIGSIAGTFAAGYWLVQSLGTRGVVLGTGAALLALAAALPARRGRPPSRPAGRSLADRWGHHRPRHALHQLRRESAYFCIRVVDSPRCMPPARPAGWCSTTCCTASITSRAGDA